MNSIPGREPRPDRSRYKSTQRNPQRGCYLALTFGTLLSSQGADAQQPDPFGFSSLATFPLYAARGGVYPVGSPRPRGASAAQQERRYTTRRTLCIRGSETPATEVQATPAGRNWTLTR